MFEELEFSWWDEILIRIKAIWGIITELTPLVLITIFLGLLYRLGKK